MTMRLHQRPTYGGKMGGAKDLPEPGRDQVRQERPLRQVGDPER